MRQKGNCNRIYRSVEWSIVKMQNEDDMQCQGTINSFCSSITCLTGREKTRRSNRSKRTMGEKEGDNDDGKGGEEDEDNDEVEGEVGEVT